MKKIMFFAALIICFTLSATVPNCDNPESKAMPYPALPDSIYYLIKDKPIIFYSYGHYGYTWSLITRIDNNFQAFSGKVSYTGDCILTEPTKANQLDSTLLFSKNRVILTWGLDTIPTEGTEMKAIKRENYVTFYDNLSVFNSDGVNVFDSDDAIAFQGPDSLEFNNKFNRLCLLMKWISSPVIREYLPESLIREGF